MPMTATTEQLTHRLATDTRAAFADYVDHFKDGLYSGLRRLAPTPGDAEDLLQDTFVRAFRALDGYDAERIGDIDLRAWTWTIALNVARNAARTRSRRPHTRPIEPVHEPSRTDDDTLDAAAWDGRLRRLSTPQRTAVVLRHVADLDYADIAAATGRPVGTVKADVHRGLAKLRTILEEETT